MPQPSMSPEPVVVISAHSLIAEKDLQQLVTQEASPGIKVETFPTATPGLMFIVLTPLGLGCLREADQQLVLERFASNIAHSPGAFGLTEAIVGRAS